ncbi:MAG: putative collagen-binding domain-containing protein [Verrucomicrobiota bacterium]
MQPFDGVSGDDSALALADREGHLLAYLPHGGAVTLDLPPAPGKRTACWFNPRTGQAEPGFSPEGGTRLSFHAPDSQDWVLVLCPG